ncbi:MAG: hypothetical protein HQ485_14120 [Acidobacteria bacterium]|nr:hypothetical protein [Acidobacteriota bacterium]
MTRPLPIGTTSIRTPPPARLSTSATGAISTFAALMSSAPPPRIIAARLCGASDSPRMVLESACEQER